MTDLSALPSVDTYWYLASPYSKYRYGMDAAWRRVCGVTGRLVKAGVPVYSPIAHTHPVALYSYMDPTDHKIWLPADEPMMRAASGLLVLMMEGWRDSLGVQFEIDHFATDNMPIYYLTWPDLNVLEKAP